MGPPPSRKRKFIRTYHCVFCNHLLLASTRDILSLPRRKAPALDGAIILPLPPPAASARAESDSEESGPELEETETETPGQAAQGGNDEEGKGDGQLELQRTGRKHASQRLRQRRGRDKDENEDEYTILLATTTPDRRLVVIRREDGFEKRLLVRCGRCRVVVAYYLDDIHFLLQEGKDESMDGKEGGSRGEKNDPKVVYLLPGAVVETKDMDGKEIVVEKEEWGAWERLGAAKEKQ